MRVSRGLAWGALLVARLLLAVVFLVAGLAKLGDRAGSRQALADFGVPGLIAAPAGMLLPVVELAVGVALVPVGSAWWGGAGRGRAVERVHGRDRLQSCPRQRPGLSLLRAAPFRAGGRSSTLARNGLLLAIAIFILAAGTRHAGASATAGRTLSSAAQWLAITGAVALAALFGATLAALRSMRHENRALAVRLEALERSLHSHGNGAAPQPGLAQRDPPAGPPVGAIAPEFELEAFDGTAVTLEQLRSTGKRLLLLFTHPQCGPCTALLPDISGWQHEHREALEIVLIGEGSAKANRAKASEQGIVNVLVQKQREVAEAYGAPGTPSAIPASPEGTIASTLAAGPDRIRALLASATGGATNGAGPGTRGNPATAMVTPKMHPRRPRDSPRETPHRPSGLRTSAASSSSG